MVATDNMVKQLLNMPGVPEKINARYKEIRKKLVSLYAAGGYVDQRAEQIQASVAKDGKTWLEMYGKISNYKNQLESWKEWMEARVNFMDIYLPTLLETEGQITATPTPVPSPKESPKATMVPTKEPQQNPQVTTMPVTACSITLDAQGGSFLANPGESIQVLHGTIGSDYCIKAKVMKKGYRFTGWYTEKVGGQKVEADQMFLLEQDVIYYAHWQKVTVAKGKIKNLKVAKGQVKINIVGQSQVAGYEIVYAANKSLKKFKRKYSTSKTVMISKLRSGKMYYIKVRAYKLDSAGKKVYGKYSSTKQVKL